MSIARQNAHSRSRTSGFNATKRRDLLAFWLFVLPSLAVFGVFTYYPVFYNLQQSFFVTNILSGSSYFVGFENYVRLLNDPVFRQVLLNTALFTLAMIFVRLPLGLAIAILLNQRVRGHVFFRALVFSPSLTSTAAVAILWIWIFDPTFGLINSFLRLGGLAGPEWLRSTEWALPAIIIMSIWKGVGYDAVIYLAGLQGIPRELYEAARIDGASRSQLFRHITVPLLSPVTLFLVITTLIGSFQVFDAVAVMTQGGPIGSTNMYVYYLYQLGFQFFDHGLATSMAVVLLGLILTLTILQLGLARRWVHY